MSFGNEAITSAFWLNNNSDNGSDIIASKYSFDHFLKINEFVIVNANEHCAICGKQIACEQKPWEHHGAPFRVKSPVALKILY